MRPTTSTHLRRALSLTAVALACAAAAGPAAAVRSGKFAGKTSQKLAVSFKVSGKKQKTVKKFTFTYRAPCNDGRTLSGSYAFNPVDLDGRKFGVTGSSSGELADGTPTVSNLKLTGKVNKKGKRATGTVSISTELPNAAGDGTATCRTGRLTYSAKR